MIVQSNILAKLYIRCSLVGLHQFLVRSQTLNMFQWIKHNHQTLSPLWSHNQPPLSRRHMVSLAAKDQEWRFKIQVWKRKKFSKKKEHQSKHMKMWISKPRIHQEIVLSNWLFLNPSQVSPSAIKLPGSLSPWAITLPSLTQPPASQPR